MKPIHLVALSYYEAMNKKDSRAFEQLLHPAVEFIGPVASYSGKDAVLNWIQGFLPKFNNVEVRAHFAERNQAMVVYDILFPEPLGRYPAASLMTFEDDLVIRLELFFDTARMNRTIK